MRVLRIGGFGEEINDGSPFWKIASKLTEQITFINRTWRTLTPMDIETADVIMTYSYGQAALWHCLDAFDPCKMPVIKYLFIIAGVPRFWWGQTYGTIWTMKEHIEKAISFNVNAIPASATIHNPDMQWLNLDCNGPGIDHMTIVGLKMIDERITSEIIDLHRELLTS